VIATVIVLGLAVVVGVGFLVCLAGIALCDLRERVLS
jgi:hypothetical protein